MPDSECIIYIYPFNERESLPLRIDASAPACENMLGCHRLNVAGLCVTGSRIAAPLQKAIKRIIRIRNGFPMGSDHIGAIRARDAHASRSFIFRSCDSALCCRMASIYSSISIESPVGSHRRFRSRSRAAVSPSRLRRIAVQAFAFAYRLQTTEKSLAQLEISFPSTQLICT